MPSNAEERSTKKNYQCTAFLRFGQAESLQKKFGEAAASIFFDSKVCGTKENPQIKI